MNEKENWIYCDIDGTLTYDGLGKWGLPRWDVIDKLKEVISNGYRVVLWSASGQEYAREFAFKYGIDGLEAILAKPSVMVDDDDGLRNPAFLTRMQPWRFVKMETECWK